MEAFCFVKPQIRCPCYRSQCSHIPPALQGVMSYKGADTLQMLIFGGFGGAHKTKGI